MKLKYKISLLFLLSITIFGGFTLFALNIENFNISLFNIIERPIDTVWDYEKKPSPDGRGYDLWQIGEKTGSVYANYTASGVTVRSATFKLDYNFTSEEDYYNNNGPAAFRLFIQEQYE